MQSLTCQRKTSTRQPAFQSVLMMWELFCYSLFIQIYQYCQSLLLNLVVLVLCPEIASYLANCYALAFEVPRKSFRQLIGKRELVAYAGTPYFVRLIVEERVVKNTAG